MIVLQLLSLPGESDAWAVSKETPQQTVQHLCTSARSHTCDPTDPCSTRVLAGCAGHPSLCQGVGGHSPASAPAEDAVKQGNTSRVGLVSAVEQEVGLKLLSELGVNSVACWGFWRNWRGGVAQASQWGCCPPSFQPARLLLLLQPNRHNLNTLERLLSAPQAGPRWIYQQISGRIRVTEG